MSFFDRGFAIFLEVEELGSSDFDVLSGTTGSWGGHGSVSLEDPGVVPEWRLVFESPHLVNRENPILVNIPEKETEVALQIYREQNGQRQPVDNDEVSYALDHPYLRYHPDAELDPQLIVSIDELGNANYLGEGFVFATPMVEYCGGLLRLDQIVIANGDVHGSPGDDPVISVFPADFRPDGSCCTFGEMMTTYPAFMELVNTAYEVTSDLYAEARPYDGATQILALVDVEGHCGGNNNPLDIFRAAI